MKKTLFITLALFTIASTAEAYYAYADFKIGAYLGSNHKMRHVLQSGSCFTQLEVSGHFGGINEPVPWRVWGNVGLVTNRSPREVRKTRFAPVSMGLLYSTDVFCLGEFYLGAGGSYGYLRFRDRSVLPNKTFVKTGWGGVLKSGFRYYKGPFFAEAFADYLIMNFHAHKRRHRRGSLVPNRLSMNGTMVGGALGWSF
jgi:outer membrane protein